VSAPSSETDALRGEARVLAGCLVGRVPPPELIDRYCEANRILLPEPPAARDAALVAFVGRHPRSAPFLDAACGVLRRDGRLRTKMLIMAAVLETSPEFADEFLPRAAPPLRLLASLAGQGLLGVTRVLLGMLLYPFAARS